MARRSSGSGSFPKWETPMTEPIIHPKQEPFIGPDNGMGAPKAPNPMRWPIPGKAKGYNIGTGGGKRWDRF